MPSLLLSVSKTITSYVWQKPGIDRKSRNLASTRQAHPSQLTACFPQFRLLQIPVIASSVNSSFN